MKKSKRSIVQKMIGSIATLFFILLVASSCFEIVTINQPATATAGEEITITLNVEVTGKDGSILVLGFCAPRAWRPSLNTTASFESDIGGSTMSMMPADELDPNNMRPWKPQLEERVGFGLNYGEMEWVVFKADTEILPPEDINEDNPLLGVVTIKTKVGTTNMKTQLGYFLGDAFWGYLKDEDENTTNKFFTECIEITGAAGSPQNLCGPAPRRLVETETFTFDDIITIVFDAQEDDTPLVDANKVFFCSKANHDLGIKEVCEFSNKTEMKQVAPDKWSLTLWPKSFYGIPDGSKVSEILANFQNENGNTIVKDLNTGEDFQIIPKCFN